MIKRGVVDLILYNEKNEILLQHRDDNAKTYPNKWCIFGGGIEKGETPIQALKRELKEELNYDVKNPKLVLEKKVDEKKYKRKLKFFIFIEEYDEQQKLILGEGKAKKWCKFEDLKNLDMIEADRKTLEEIWDKLNI